MILVTFAVPQESRDFRRALAGRTGEEVRVAHLGIGHERAAQETARLLALERPRLVICAGFGGGLDERLHLADVIIAENYSSPDLLARARNMPGDNSQRFFGSLVSHPTTVETLAAKAELARTSGALAVDMETAAVFAACQSQGIPMLAIRSISDTVSTEIPIPFAECYDMKRQRPRSWGVVKYLLTHPGSIAPFASFLSGLAPANRALSEFISEFLAAPE